MHQNMVKNVVNLHEAYGFKDSNDRVNISAVSMSKSRLGDWWRKGIQKNQSDIE